MQTFNKMSHTKDNVDEVVLNPAIMKRIADCLIASVDKTLLRSTSILSLASTSYASSVASSDEAALAIIGLKMKQL